MILDIGFEETNESITTTFEAGQGFDAAFEAQNGGLSAAFSAADRDFEASFGEAKANFDSDFGEVQVVSDGSSGSTKEIIRISSIDTIYETVDDIPKQYLMVSSSCIPVKADKALYRVENHKWVKYHELNEDTVYIVTDGEKRGIYSYRYMWTMQFNSLEEDAAAKANAYTDALIKEVREEMARLRAELEAALK